jgi:hypothetical protein
MDVTARWHAKSIDNTSARLCRKDQSALPDIGFEGYGNAEMAKDF